MNRYHANILISVTFLGAGIFFGLEGASAQQPANLTNATANMNFTKLIEDKYPARNHPDAQLAQIGIEGAPVVFHDVSVKYESPTTLLISGDLITRSELAFNSYIWDAMDMLKNQYGFKVQNVMTSGVGSEGNPTTVYILMTK